LPSLLLKNDEINDKLYTSARSSLPCSYRSRGAGEYVLDLRLGYPFATAMKSDDVADTLNYAEAFNVIREVMKQPARLLESVAGSIVEALCAAFPMLSSIDLKLVKLNPPMGADSDGAGVELHLINDKTEV